MTTERRRDAARASGCWPRRRRSGRRTSCSCYVTAAIWCAKFGGPRRLARRRAHGDRRLHRRRARRRSPSSAGAAAGATRHGRPSCRTTPTRPRTATASSASRRCCSSGLSAVATLFTALAAVFFGNCRLMRARCSCSLGLARAGRVPGSGRCRGSRRGSFAAHMTMHMARGRGRGAAARARRRRRAARSGAQGAALFAPIPASLVEFVVVWAWHAPALHHAARHARPASSPSRRRSSAAGLARLAVGVRRRRARARDSRRGAGVVALLLTSMHMTLLGALLALAPRAALRARGRRLGLTPLEDQHLGGVMLLVGGAVVSRRRTLAHGRRRLRGRRRGAPATATSRGRVGTRRLEARGSATRYGGSPAGACSALLVVGLRRGADQGESRPLADHRVVPAVREAPSVATHSLAIEAPPRSTSRCW